MKIGQTSVILFVTKILGSIVGFISTIYFARELGAEIIGIFALITTVVGWSSLIANVGFGGALVKRLSEGKQRQEFLSASFIIVFSLSVIVSIFIITFQDYVEAYVSGFDNYIQISVVWIIILFMFVSLFTELVTLTLKGESKVHISGTLALCTKISRRIIQVLLVFAGYNLLGMIIGYAVGTVLLSFTGLYWVSTRFSIPKIRHFKSLYNYAKYSWLGGLKTRTFNDVDILLLGVFVSSGSVGIYSISWSIAKFLGIFSASVKSTVFPEISNKSAHGRDKEVSEIIKKAITYSGLIAIPGLVGGIILRERLLQIYGEEFVRGSLVLVILIFAVLIQSYQKQFLNGFNGMDRPNLSFRINSVFITVNIVLNILLIRHYGIEGAAAATAISASIALVFSVWTANRVIKIQVPYQNIGYQLIASLVMGIVVLGILYIVETSAAGLNNIITVLISVLLGALVYFVTLSSISDEFRRIIIQNLPSAFD